MSHRGLWAAGSAAVLLVSGGVAAAAPGQVVLHPLPAFAEGPKVVVSWDPAAFTLGSTSRQYRVTAQDLTAPAFKTAVVNVPSTAATLTLVDGHEYSVTALAVERECAAPGVCDPTQVNGPESEARVTRVDATAPVVTAQINGGAPFTSDPAVVLDLAAQDPSVGGTPSSGVRTLQIAQPGAFSCPVPVAGSCLVPFAQSLPITLSPGPDGPRTVSVTAYDGATTAGAVGAAAATPDGNASATATATVLLDRRPPTPRVGMSGRIARPRVPFAIGGRKSVDGIGGVADSGLDASGFSWSFGDGTTAQGPLVRHAYAGLGTYKGTLRLVDRAGNAAAANFTVFVGDSTGIVIRGRGHVLAPRKLSSLRPRRTTVLRWRPNPRARFYNVQLYRVRFVRGQIVRTRLVSTFPRRPRQTIPGRFLRRGTYHLVVWSGVRSEQPAYAPKPWIVVVLKARAVRHGSAHEKSPAVRGASVERE